jgi:hypothetical protein
MIFVGVVSYCLCSASAIATAPDVDPVLAALLAEPVELDELDEPHAAKAAAIITAMAGAAI